MSDLNTEQQFDQGRQAFFRNEQLDAQTFGKESVEHNLGYQAMEPIAPLPSDRSDVEITTTELEDAAAALQKDRDERLGKPPGETVREYKQDNPNGIKLDEHFTVSAEQAAADLTAARNRDENILELDERAELQRAIDALRNDAPEQVQPLTQPQADQIGVQQEQHQQAAVDDDWQRHMQDPRVLNAIQQHTDQLNAQANQTIAAYNSAAIDAANRALIGLTVAYPELKGITAQQLPTAIQVVAQQNPQRAQDIVSSIGLINDTVARGMEAQKAQTQQWFVQHRKQWNSWAAQQDAAYEHFARQVPAAERAAIEAEARRMVLEGSDPQNVAMSWHTSPELRSATAQRLLFDSARWRLHQRAQQKVQQSIKQKLDRTPPHVQRPGSPAERMPDSIGYLDKLSRRIDDNPKGIEGIILSDGE
jgi:hypothetical protein